MPRFINGTKGHMQRAKTSMFRWRGTWPVFQRCMFLFGLRVADIWNLSGPKTYSALHSFLSMVSYHIHLFLKLIVGKFKEEKKHGS